MLFSKIHHVAIIASDYEKSKHFYTEILELPIIREIYRVERDSYKLDLKIGDSEIELFSFPNPPKRKTGPEAVGLRHLCLTTENVEVTVEKLEKRGIVCEPIRIDESTNTPYTFFKDPDGLPIELKE
ncbi:VOC family protein [Jeotgalibaca sp. MA1X17-3]|uniref:SMU1112c/YaeR family gloxylase I-like metalloprotein n=1 Tax=Jeotgalibaca sp. MA1X17-3 TaxID=2908211 RepID=UPI001F385863|nr:VOC family protein [Jeotgalibaca sp. MA1X17-3]UJF15699.1 VOC family protein [Jeotgalibaca sp. MA1X17-3]